MGNIKQATFLTNWKLASIISGVEVECENNTTATEPSANGLDQISLFLT